MSRTARMPASLARIAGCAVLVAAFASPSSAATQEGLDVDGYVEIVLRAHPAAKRSAGLESAASAEQKAARLLPDPRFEYTRDRAQSPDASGVHASENGYSVSQTIPWPGSFSAGVRVADRAADVLRANAEELRWTLTAAARKAFNRLLAARALADVATAAEEDARSLRDLVTRRADLGEARESDRIKASVEWLRQQRSLAAAQREAEASERIARTLAVEPLPRPLLLKPSPRRPMPPLDGDTLMVRLASHSPRLRAASAEAERQRAALSAARRSRIPDLELTVFRDEEIDKTASGLSLGVKVPLWNANRGEIARAEAVMQVAAAEAERVRLELATELESRLKELQIAAAQSTLLDSDILPAAGRSVEIARLSFQEGETSLLDLLDAQRTYRETLREAAEAHLAMALAAADLQELVGPDFDPWRQP